MTPRLPFFAFKGWKHYRKEISLISNDAAQTETTGLAAI